MKAIKLLGETDDQHRLHATVPENLPAGSVRIIVLTPDEDEAGSAWAAGVAAEWSADLGDSRQDIYSLDDGPPVDEASAISERFDAGSHPRACSRVARVRIKTADCGALSPTVSIGHAIFNCGILFLRLEPRCCAVALREFPPLAFSVRLQRN